MRPATSIATVLSFVSRKPSALRVELTNHCNLRCKMCGIWAEKPKKTITPATYEEVLAEPILSRLRLISLLQAQPDGEACVCHLTEPLGLSQPTVSHHLKLLLQAGLVERDQRGSWAYYRVVPEPLAGLRALLT